MSSSQTMGSPAQAAIAAPEQVHSPLTLYHFELAQALHQNRLQIGHSQLLGCDYVFINAQLCPELFSEKRLLQNLQELLEILELRLQQTALVQIDDSDADYPQFIRYELTFNRQHLKAVTPVPVIQPEQQEFMRMLWDCSSSY